MLKSTVSALMVCAISLFPAAVAAEEKSPNASQTVEQRIGELEDRLAIYQILATHPLTADTGYGPSYDLVYTEDTVFERAGAAGGGVVGRDKLVASAEGEAHQKALNGGLAHFASLPYLVQIEGDKAEAFSYLMLITANQDVPARELSNHGTSLGHEIFRVLVNRWELQRNADGWRVSKRTLVTHDGKRPGARDMMEMVLKAN